MTPVDELLVSLLGLFPAKYTFLLIFLEHTSIFPNIGYIFVSIQNFVVAPAGSYSHI